MHTIATATLDATLIHQYATFQTHSRKVVSNLYGLFAVYIGDTDPTGGVVTSSDTVYHWYLLQSTDDGQTWTRVYAGTGAEHPPVLETDSQGRLFVLYCSGVTANTSTFLRFEHSNGYSAPVVSVTLASTNAGKIAAHIDEGRQQLYFALWGRTLITLGYDGTVKATLTAVQNSATNEAEYPLLSLDEHGTLFYAWTTTPLTPPPNYWDIHVMRSPDGGVSWTTLNKTPLTLPVVCDNTGPTDELVLADEYTSDTWCANILAHGGKLHVVYMAQTSPYRQHYLRYDLGTGALDLNYWPAFGGRTLHASTGLANFALDATGSRLYLLCQTDPNYASDARLLALYSDDNGSTWQDLAASAPVGSFSYDAIYAPTIPRVLPASGTIAGLYTQNYQSSSPSVINFRVSQMVAQLSASATVITDAVPSTIERTLATSGDGLGGPVVASNPSGAGGSTTGWAVAANATLTAVPETLFGPSYAYCLRAVYSGTGNRIVRTQLANVQPDLGLSWTFGAYLEGGGSGNLEVHLLDPTDTTNLATATFTVTGDVGWFTVSFTSGQLSGYVNPYIEVWSNEAATSRIVRFVGMAPQPPADSSMGVYGAATNLIQYSDTTTDWTASDGGATLTLANTTADGKFNGKAIRGNWAASGNAVGARFGFSRDAHAAPATPGTSYVLMVWSRLSSGSVSANGVGILLQWLDASGNFLGSTAGTAWTPTGAWVRQQNTGVAPAGAAYVIPYVETLVAGPQTFGLDFVAQIEAPQANTALTTSGYLVTDSLRVTSTPSDGLTSPQYTTVVPPAITNLVHNSGAEVNTAATITVGGGTTTITRDTTVHKFGVASYKVVNDATSGGGMAIGATSTTDAAAIVAGTTYTISVWVLGNLGTEALNIAATWYPNTFTGGTTDAGVNFTATTGWVKYSYTATAPVGTQYAIIRVRNAAAVATTYWVDGGQLEAGLAANPHVSTTTGAVTSTAGRVTTSTPQISPTTGAFAIAFSPLWPSTDTTVRTLMSVYHDANNWRRIYWDGAGHYVSETMDAGVSLKATSAAQSFSANAQQLVCGNYTSNGPYVSANGAAFINTTGRTGIVSAFDPIDLGSHNGTQQIDAAVSWAIGWTGTTLLNADATTLYNGGSFTAVPTVATARSLAAGTATVALLWPGASSTYLTLDPPQATPYVPTNAATATRAAATLTAPSNLLSYKRFWAMLRIAPNWDSTTPPNAQPTALSWASGVAGNAATLRWSAANTGWAFEADASGASPIARVADTFTRLQSRTVGCYLDSPHSLIGINLNAGAWQTAAYSGVLTGMLDHLDLLEGVNPGNGKVLWLVLGTGDPTQLNLSKSYWTSDSDPNLDTIRADSPSAGATAVIPFTDLNVVNIPWTATGTWAAAPIASGVVSLAPVG